MLEAVQDGLNRFGDFNGRSTRPQFWYFFVFYVGLSIASSIIFSDLIDTVLSFVIFIPYLAVAVRRMHDVGRSGWFVIVPIVNLVFLASETKQL